MERFYTPLLKAMAKYEFGQNHGELAPHEESLPVPPEFDDPIVIAMVIDELREILKANTGQYFKYEVLHILKDGVGHILVQRSNTLCEWRQS